MIKTELIQRSPLRILEKTTNGGVGKGNIGIIMSPKGIGKTACLVHIATDQLIQGNHVIHVTFASNPNHIISWYEEIFQKISHRYNLDDTMAIHDEMVKNRVIMNFNQNGLHITEIENRIRTLIDQTHFKADTVVIDGYDFYRSSSRELQEYRSFAKELDLELWFSASIIEKNGFTNSDTPSFLKTLSSEIAVIIQLEPKDDFVHLKLLKDHNSALQNSTHLRLDPHILLIAEE